MAPRYQLNADGQIEATETLETTTIKHWNMAMATTDPYAYGTVGVVALRIGRSRYLVAKYHKVGSPNQVESERHFFHWNEAKSKSEAIAMFENLQEITQRLS